MYINRLFTTYLFELAVSEHHSALLKRISRYFFWFLGLRSNFCSFFSSYIWYFTFFSCVTNQTESFHMNRKRNFIQQKQKNHNQDLFVSIPTVRCSGKKINEYLVEAQFTTANSRNATVVDSSCLITERWCCVCFDSRQYHRTPSPMLSVCIFLGFELVPSHGRSASGEATLLIMARRTTTPTVNQQPK